MISHSQNSLGIAEIHFLSRIVAFGLDRNHQGVFHTMQLIKSKSPTLVLAWVPSCGDSWGSQFTSALRVSPPPTLIPRHNIIPIYIYNNPTYATLPQLAIGVAIMITQLGICPPGHTRTSHQCMPSKPNFSCKVSLHHVSIYQSMHCQNLYNHIISKPL